jgi:hypothetical protein
MEHAGCVFGLKAVQERVDLSLMDDDNSGVAALSAGVVGILAGLRTNENIVSASRHEDRNMGYEHTHV